MALIKKYVFDNQRNIVFENAYHRVGVLHIDSTRNIIYVVMNIYKDTQDSIDNKDNPLDSKRFDLVRRTDEDSGLLFQNLIEQTGPVRQILYNIIKTLPDYEGAVDA